uniref:Uncharacterized protein n=1 Tax=Anguilla anguilla TaxID=7936 RepID=A0A0E9XJ25_ANGAN
MECVSVSGTSVSLHTPVTLSGQLVIHSLTAQATHSCPTLAQHLCNFDCWTAE